MKISGQPRKKSSHVREAIHFHFGTRVVVLVAFAAVVSYSDPSPKARHFGRADLDTKAGFAEMEI